MSLMNEPRAFVCGHPIAHSRSPIIHRHWLQHYGIRGSYDPVDVAPADFARFVDEVKAGRFAGGNVTMPHKEQAFRLVSRRTDEAEQIGAVNTLWLADGELCGTNTDAYGFAGNLDQRSPGWDSSKSAAILGAGGAARAIVFALKQRGFTDIRIVNRTLDRARDLADRFGKGVSSHELNASKEVLSGVGLVVNTTALGMDGDRELPASPEFMSDGTLVTDIVYVPLETPFLAAARRRGLKTADGLGMLLHQAVPGFEIWFGQRPEVSVELRDIIVADLGRHG